MAKKKTAVVKGVAKAAPKVEPKVEAPVVETKVEPKKVGIGIYLEGGEALRVTDVQLNGVAYKDVLTIGGCTYRMSEEEFNCLKRD